jgi:phosphatidylglycerophosphate synthase
MNNRKSATASPRRHNQSFLAAREKQIIAFLIELFPQSVTPNHLTVVGLLGAVMTATALIGCNWLPAFDMFIPIGILLNWLGDSLDGSLARHRQIERPRFGFLVDHTSDLFAQILVIIGFGLSPFFSLTSSLLVLICYLVFSAYTYIRACTHHVHQMAYIGIGATEFRLLMLIWPFIASLIGPGLFVHAVLDLSRLDFVVAVLGGFAFVGLAWKAYFDAREIAAEEGSRPFQVVATASVSEPVELLSDLREASKVGP